MAGFALSSVFQAYIHSNLRAALKTKSHASFRVYRRRLRHSGRELWSPGLDLASARSGKGQPRGLKVKTEARRHSERSHDGDKLRRLNWITVNGL